MVVQFPVRAPVTHGPPAVGITVGITVGMTVGITVGYPLSAIRAGGWVVNRRPGRHSSSMPSPFAITAAEPTVVLTEHRIGEMTFTVTNMTDEPVQARASVVALDPAPPAWFSIAGKADLTLRPRATAQVLVRVEPPLGAPAARHAFRVDVANVARPEAGATPGPSCAVVVPPSRAPVNLWKTPRGYLATLVGASVGGALGELVVFLAVRAPKQQQCSTVDCA